LKPDDIVTWAPRTGTVEGLNYNDNIHIPWNVPVDFNLFGKAVDPSHANIPMRQGGLHAVDDAHAQTLIEGGAAREQRHNRKATLASSDMPSGAES
jgi:hypothetical protein